jgi:nucleotide-binding universal stress UspA family protein
MVFLVPFDASPLSRSALRRASRFADDRDVVALCVIPAGEKYARRKDWLDPGEEFDFATVRDWLESRVAEAAPDAEFQYIRTESRPPGTEIAKAIRRKAQEVDAEIVFLGSKNAGKVVTPVTSVGSGVTTDESYDVYIARHRIGD